MSKRTKQPTSAPCTNGNPSVSRDSVNLYFLDNAKKAKNSGENDYADSFIRIMNAVQAAKPAFDITDMYAFASNYGIPNHVLKELWEKWVEAMVMWKKVERTPSVYDNGDLIVTLSM